MNMPKKQENLGLLDGEGYKVLEAILEEWKKKGIVQDEEAARFNLEMMLHLYIEYNLNDLLKTLIEIDDFVNENVACDCEGCEKEE